MPLLLRLLWLQVRRSLPLTLRRRRRRVRHTGALLLLLLIRWHGALLPHWVALLLGWCWRLPRALAWRTNWCAACSEQRAQAVAGSWRSGSLIKAC